ncbi:MAG: methyltransferase domain-containing protein [Candidatus Binataceae bacterium]
MNRTAKHQAPSRSDSTAGGLRLKPDTYIVQTQPGFEEIALDEAKARIAGARVVGRRLVPDRSGLGIFAAHHPNGIAKLRTAEDIFALVGYRNGLGAERSALDKMRAAIRDMPMFEWALPARVMLAPGSRAGRRLGFRVIARMTGEREFRRADFKRIVERGMLERGDHVWRLDEERADLEIWANLIDQELIVAVRLSDDRIRHRGLKIVDRPGALRPALAAALAWLSHPSDEDIVLDPFCGTASILIERARMGRYTMLYGFDRDSAAIEAARANVGPRYKPIELHVSDAGAIPLDNHSVTKIIANLPWGVQYGSHGDNRRLYPRIMAEFRRVLAREGRIVLLTGETRLIRELAAGGALTVEREIRVSILGARAAVYAGRIA